MTEAEVRAHKYWKDIPPQRQKWVLAYLTTHDMVAAAHEAYACKDDKNAKSMAQRCLRDWKIRQVLGITEHTIEQNLVTRLEAMQLISDRLRSCPSAENKNFIDLFEIYAELKGWMKATYRGLQFTGMKKNDKKSEKQEQASEPTPEPEVDPMDEVLRMEKEAKKHGKEN